MNAILKSVLEPLIGKPCNILIIDNMMHCIDVVSWLVNEVVTHPSGHITVINKGTLFYEEAAKECTTTFIETLLVKHHDKINLISSPVHSAMASNTRIYNAIIIFDKDVSLSGACMMESCVSVFRHLKQQGTIVCDTCHYQDVEAYVNSYNKYVKTYVCEGYVLIQKTHDIHETAIRPTTLEQFVNTTTYVINLASDSDRLKRSIDRLRDAGFHNIKRVEGIDGHNIQLIEELWEKCEIRSKLDDFDAHARGCLMTHLTFWKYMIDNSIEDALIFEDDLYFHKDWKTLGKLLLSATPSNVDMIYLGHHTVNISVSGDVAMYPVFCLNAYYLTYKGAQKLYSYIVNSEMVDPVAVDNMIYGMQQDILSQVPTDPRALVWTCWNSSKYPDPIAQDKIAPSQRFVDQGFVFQEARLDT